MDSEWKYKYSVNFLTQSKYIELCTWVLEPNRGNITCLHYLSTLRFLVTVCLYNIYNTYNTLLQYLVCDNSIQLQYIQSLVTIRMGSTYDIHSTCLPTVSGNSTYLQYQSTYLPVPTSIYPYLQYQSTLLPVPVYRYQHTYTCLIINLSIVTTHIYKTHLTVTSISLVGTSST